MLPWAKGKPMTWDVTVPDTFAESHIDTCGERLRGKRQAWCLLQVKLCDPCLSSLKWFVYHARRYTSARLGFTE